MVDLVLIVDDDPVQRRLLEASLGKLGHQTVSADGGNAALDILTGKDAPRICLIILDLVMPDMDGMAVLTAMADRKISRPVIVQTAQGGVETAVKAMRAGASDFVVKPTSPQRLEVSIQNALKLGALEGEIKRIKKSATGKLTFDEIISASPNMARVKEIGQKAAQSSIPVLIEGESGVGKELIARAIQGLSERSSKSFITVNCGALPENLVESILFGHEKGAFTGASDKHPGMFRQADGGTLFLDEVGELTLDMQVKLLRAIQEGEIDPVGSNKPVKVNFRLISATNKNLLEEVKLGNFREDLYYRLSVLPLTVPPLRERPDDIPGLLRHFMARIATEEGRSHIKSIEPKAIEMLCEFDWPGNIRQLENAVFRAIVLCDGDVLTISDFPQIVPRTNTLLPGSDELPAPSISPAMVEPGAIAAADITAREQPAPAPQAQCNQNSVLLVDQDDNLVRIENIEREIIRFAIRHQNGRMTEVAQKLGIGRSTLYRKLRDYGLEDMGQNLTAPAN